MDQKLKTAILLAFMFTPLFFSVYLGTGSLLMGFTVILAASVFGIACLFVVSLVAKIIRSSKDEN